MDALEGETVLALDPTELGGLSAREVAERIADHQDNAVRQRTSRPLSAIIVNNVFTWFNLLLGVLFVLMITFGSWRDALFGVVLVLNTLIGIGQEVRAKLTLDRLSLLSAPKARVVREGAVDEIAVEEVVLDDVVLLQAGDQVVADGDVIASDGLELDESLLTGEAATVLKQKGDRVMSGTFAVAGAGAFVATHVGEKAYAQCITAETKRFTRMRSDVMDGINTILKTVGVVLVPAALLMGWSQLRNAPDVNAGVTGIVAALVAMVPEGLVLLSSIAFAVSTIALARRRVLANELPAVEGLARVDVVCADKTGTLTEPEPAFGRFELASGASEGVSNAEGEARSLAALGALALAGEGENSTIRAIAQAVPAPEGWHLEDRVPFSSARKWSAARFASEGTWVLGAPDVLATSMTDGEQLLARVRALASEGRRVLLLARSSSALDGERLPADLRAAGYVLLVERVRDDAADTIRYLTEQGVSLRILSGDSPTTVAAVARAAGVTNADPAVDARELREGPELEKAMEQTIAFGRVMPEQKAAMIAALQRNGHVVAMTGDGVNDVPAVKAADLGIAMGSGAPATRSVAQIVLLDSQFAALPLVMAEGRRVIANAERVANLFVTKTVWAAVLAVLIALAGVPYPFLPRQITLAGSLTIGIPAFFLALGPNTRRYQPGFVQRVGKFVLPAGTLIALAVLATYALARASGVSLAEARSLCTVTLLITGLGVLAAIEWPLDGWRLVLLATMAGAAVVVFLVPALREFFALELFVDAPLAETLAVSAAACAGIFMSYRVNRH